MPYFSICACYICFSIIQFVSFLSETKTDGLVNETDAQMDAVADRLATCMWTLGTFMKLDTERQMDLPIKLMTRWMLHQMDLLFAYSQPF